MGVYAPGCEVGVKNGVMKNGVSSIFGPITILFNYFNESKIELTPFSLPQGERGFFLAILVREKGENHEKENFIGFPIFFIYLLCSFASSWQKPSGVSK
jgi:hypothetical protein